MATDLITPAEKSSMLMLSIPKSEPIGNCSINGRPAEYRVDLDHLEFRYEGEAWDRRRILDAFQDGDVIRYSCDDGPGSTGPYVILRPQLIPSPGEQFYWLAINGASCAASVVPLPLSVRAKPTPEQLVGFRTREEQLAIQKFLITAPIEKVNRYLAKELPNKIKTGEVAYLRPHNPEPPTRGATMWEAVESAEASHV
jgi:hypothetical protein